MVKLIEGLNLERILNGASLACPEFEEYMSTPNYRSEKNLHILPDTHLYSVGLPERLELQARGYNQQRIREEGQLPKIRIRTLPIINEELQRDGLKRYGGVIPEELLRGEESLNRLLGGIPDWYKEKITLFYDIATESFKDLIDNLFKYSDNQSEHSTPGKVAQDFMISNNMCLRDGIQQSYHAMFTKLLKKRRVGNEFNYVADKILALTNFGANCFLPNDKSLLLTADSDFEAIEHFIYQTVFPQYLTGSVKKMIEENFPRSKYIIKMMNTKRPQLDRWVGEQIRSLERDSRYPSQITNLIFNCRTGKVTVNYLHPAMSRFTLPETFR